MESWPSRCRRLAPAIASLAGIVLVSLALAGGAAHAAAYPLRIKESGGTVTIPSRPNRIVSLSPSATQDLFAVGAGAQVVAVDSYSTYPARAPHTTLSAYTPNVEAIASYRPDLVIVAFDEDHVVEQLRTLGVPVLLEPAVTNLAGAYAEIEQIAHVTGHPAGGNRVVVSMRRQVAAILRSVGRPRRRLTVYNELDQDFYSATSHTLIGSIDRMLGLVNIADRAPGSNPYPQLSAEYVVASDPDLIVLADTVCCHQDLATLRTRPGWDAIAAVERGDVVPINDAIASQWGPRVLLLIADVGRAVRRLEGRSA